MTTYGDEVADLQRRVDEMTAALPWSARQAYRLFRWWHRRQTTPLDSPAPRQVRFPDMAQTTLTVDLGPALMQVVERIGKAADQAAELHRWGLALREWGYSSIDVVTPFGDPEATYIRCVSPTGRERIVRTAEDFAELERTATAVQRRRRGFFR